MRLKKDIIDFISITLIVKHGGKDFSILPHVSN